VGYYIQTDKPTNKAQWIAAHGEGVIVGVPPASYAEIPEGKALVVVVDNVIFESAAFCFDEDEFEAFVHEEGPGASRFRQFVIVDREWAEYASGFRGRRQR
jgi:hypothetical protein